MEIARVPADEGIDVSLAAIVGIRFASATAKDGLYLPHITSALVVLEYCNCKTLNRLHMHREFRFGLLEAAN